MKNAKDSGSCVNECKLRKPYKNNSNGVKSQSFGGQLT